MGLVGVDDPPVGQLEHLRLGDVEGLGDVVGLVVAELGDLAGHADEPAQHGGVLHDAAVARGVGDGRGGGLQVDQEVRAPDGVEEVVAAELVGHGHGVDRLADGRRAPGWPRTRAGGPACRSRWRSGAARPPRRWRLGTAAGPRAGTPRRPGCAAARERQPVAGALVLGPPRLATFLPQPWGSLGEQPCELLVDRGRWLCTNGGYRPPTQTPPQPEQDPQPRGRNETPDQMRARPKPSGWDPRTRRRWPGPPKRAGERQRASPRTAPDRTRRRRRASASQPPRTAPDRTRRRRGQTRRRSARVSGTR